MLKFIIIVVYFSYYTFTALSAPIIKASGVQWSEPKGNGKGNITLIMIPQNNSCGNDSDMIVAVKSDYQILSQDMQLLNLVVNDNQCKSTTLMTETVVDKCTTLNKCSIQEQKNDRMKNPNTVKYFESAKKIDDIFNKNDTAYNWMETTLEYNTPNIFKLLGLMDIDNVTSFSNPVKEYPSSSTITNTVDMINLLNMLNISESNSENTQKNKTVINMGTGGVTSSMISFNDALSLLQGLNYPSENNNNKNFITNNFTENSEIKLNDDTELLESRIKNLKEENLALASDEADSLTKDLAFPGVGNIGIANQEEKSDNSLENALALLAAGRNDTFNLGSNSGIGMEKKSQLSDVGNDKLSLRENSPDGFSKEFNVPVGKTHKSQVEENSSDALRKVLGILGVSNNNKFKIEGNPGISEKGQGLTDIDNIDRSSIVGNLVLSQGLSEARKGDKSNVDENAGGDLGNSLEHPNIQRLNIKKNSGDNLVSRSGLDIDKINKCNLEGNSYQDLGKGSLLSSLEKNSNYNLERNFAIGSKNESGASLVGKNDKSNLAENLGDTRFLSDCLTLFVSVSSQANTENLLTTNIGNSIVQQTITDNVVPVTPNLIINGDTDHPSELTDQVKESISSSLISVETTPVFNEESGPRSAPSSQNGVSFLLNYVTEMPQGAKGYTTDGQFNDLPNVGNCNTTVIVQCDSTTNKGVFEQISQMVIDQAKISTASSETEIVATTDSHKLEIDGSSGKKITLEPPKDCETYLKMNKTLNVIDHESQCMEKNLALPFVESSVFLANNNELPKGQGIPVVLNTSLDESSFADLQEKSDPIHGKLAKLYNNNNNKMLVNVEDRILTYSSLKPLDVKRNDKRKIFFKTSNTAENRLFFPDINHILKMHFAGRNIILEQKPSYRSGVTDIVCETTPENNLEHSNSDTGPDDEENSESQLNIPLKVTTMKNSKTEHHDRNLDTTLQLESTTKSDLNTHHNKEHDKLVTTLKTLITSTTEVMQETTTISSSKNSQSSPDLQENTDSGKAGYSLQNDENIPLELPTTSTIYNEDKTLHSNHHNKAAGEKKHSTKSLSTSISNDETETSLSNLHDKTTTESIILSTDEIESSYEVTFSSTLVPTMSTNYKKTTTLHTQKQTKTANSEDEKSAEDLLAAKQIGTTSNSEENMISSQSSHKTTRASLQKTTNNILTFEPPSSETKFPSETSQNKQGDYHQCEKNMYIPANSVKEIVIQIIRNTKKPQKNENSKLNYDRNNFVVPYDVNYAQKDKDDLPQSITQLKKMFSNEDTESNIPSLNMINMKSNRYYNTQILRPEMETINRISDAKSKNLLTEQNLRNYQRENIQHNINNPQKKKKIINKIV